MQTIRIKVKLIPLLKVFLFTIMTTITCSAYAWIEYASSCCGDDGWVSHRGRHHRTRHHRHYRGGGNYSLSITTIAPFTPCGDFWGCQYDTLATTCGGCSSDFSVFYSQPDMADYGGCTDPVLNDSADTINYDYDMAN